MPGDGLDDLEAEFLREFELEEKVAAGVPSTRGEGAAAAPAGGGAQAAFDADFDDEFDAAADEFDQEFGSEPAQPALVASKDAFDDEFGDDFEDEFGDLGAPPAAVVAGTATKPVQTTVDDEWDEL